MKRRIDYESETNLPASLAKAFVEAEKNILEAGNEEDKIILYLARLRFICTIWFSEHQIIMTEEE